MAVTAVMGTLEARTECMVSFVTLFQLIKSSSDNDTGPVYCIIKIQYCSHIRST